MNCAFNEMTHKAYIVISWDVGRPGLWYSIEPYISRTQFKEIARRWSTPSGRVLTDFKNIERETIQDRKAFFQSVYSDKVFYCKIVAMGDLKFCMDEFKKLEDYTLKYPLNVYEYLVAEANLGRLAHGSDYNSCRSEVVNRRLQLDACVERVENGVTINKSCQVKRENQSKTSPCNNKRIKFNLN